MIKEEFISILDRPDIMELYKKEYTNHVHIDFSVYKYAHAIYLETKPCKSIRILLTDTDYTYNFQKGRFLSNLDKLKSKGFYDLLYLTTLHPSPLWDEIYKQDPFEIKNYKQSKILNDYLNISFGHLVYHYQLEQLYSMLTGNTQDIAREFRKNIGKRNSVSFEQTSKLQFKNGQTLKEIMNERMVYKFTFPENFNGAMALFDYLATITL